MENKDLYCILDANYNLVPEPDIVKWADWINNQENKILKRSSFQDNGNTVTVTTIFSGLNTDLPFSVMVDGGRYDGAKWHVGYYTIAIATHDNVVEDSKSSFRSLIHAAEESTRQMLREETEYIHELKREIQERYTEDF